MGAEIDRLELQVEAQATKANNQLEKLVGKLEAVANSLSHINTGGLTGLANGVQKFAQASSQLSSVKTADFTRLTKNIDKLSALNTQQIFSASSAITTLSKAVDGLGSVSGGSAQLASVVNSVSALGGANVQRAVANLPVLANALNSFMATMSNAPAVSRNVIRMTDALASLAAQGGNVRAAGNLVARSTDNVGNAMSRNVGRINSFSLTLQSLARIYTLLKRGAQKLWTSIESSMSYVETLNYFDAAYGQVAEKAVSQWADMGAASAEEYYNSFSKRAKELTSKMTGFSVNDDGTLTATGQASLGINPSQLMNYQAMFAQMSSSMGVASETSLKLSQALTEIGGDLASVKNMDFDKVWQDMASGLAGMSRTLDKYGVNIRNVNLQQRLMELGIDANITALNQNDKALLRAIILLDSTRYAWGDLADTINQPANQIRLLESNWANLSRTIGNIFLPVVAKVLPYVNGLVIAVQRLFTWLGSLIGLDLSSITSSVGNSDFDFGSLIDDTDGLTDSMNDAAKAADKLKKGIRAFDELNVITTSDDSGKSTAGSGTGGFSSRQLDAAFDDIFSEYQARWDAAYAQLENRANGFADKIVSVFTKVWKAIEPFRAAIVDLWNNGLSRLASFSGNALIDFYDNFLKPLGVWAFGTEDAGLTRLVNIINDGLMKVDWETLNTSLKNFWIAIEPYAEQFGEGLIDFFEDISGVAVDAINKIPDVLDKFTEVLNNGDPEKARDWGYALGVLATSLLAFNTLSKVIDVISGLSTAVDKFIKVLKGIGTITGLSAGIAGAGGLGNFLTLDMAALVGEGAVGLGTMIGTAVIAGIVAAIGGWLTGQKLWKLITGEDIDMTFGEQMSEIFSSFTDGSAGEAFDLWVQDIRDGIREVSDDIEDFHNTKLGKIIDFVNTGGFSPLADNVKTAFRDIKDGMGEIDIAGWWEKDVAPWFTKDKWKELGENMRSKLHDKWEEFTGWFDKTGIGQFWDTVSDKFSLDSWKEFGENMRSKLHDKWEEFTGWYNGEGTSKWWSNIKDKFSKNTWTGFGENMKSSLTSKWNSFTLWYNNTGFATWWRGVQEKFSKNSWNFSGIKEGLSSAWNAAIESIKGLWNKFADWINNKLEIKIDTDSVIGKGIAGVLGTDKISLGKIPSFSIGGFPPEDGLFYANHGELVGQFSNGKTAVANNEQITDGIAIAVQNANQETNMLLKQQNELLQAILQKPNLDNNDIFNAARSVYKDNATRRYGSSNAFDPVWG